MSFSENVNFKRKIFIKKLFIQKKLIYYISSFVREHDPGFLKFFKSSMQYFQLMTTCPLIIFSRVLNLY